MKKKVFGKKLNRNIKTRKALFRGLIISLIIKGGIKTTMSKAKAVKGLAEKLVTLAKKQTDSAKERLSATLQNRKAKVKLEKEIAVLFKDVKGGYTRIQKTAERKGDGAEVVFLEWTKQVTKDRKIGKKKPVSKKVKEKETKKPAKEVKIKNEKAK